MKRKSLFIVFSVAAMVLVTIIIAFNWIGIDMMNLMKRTKIAMDKKEFVCAKVSRVVIEPWGERGYARYCVKDGKRHGTWEAWEKSRLVIQGNYYEGVEQGNWVWYREDGSVYRIREYRDGLLVRDEIRGGRELGSDLDGLLPKVD
jgi:hypothetical protein